MNGREDGKLYDQVRVIELWIEKFKAMGTRTLDDVEGGGGSTKNRVIFPDMLHMGMFKGVYQ